MTSHQKQLFCQSNPFYDELVDIRLFYDQTASGFEDAQQFFNRLPLIAKVVQRINHQNPIKTFIGERELFDVGLSRL